MPSGLGELVVLAESYSTVYYAARNKRYSELPKKNKSEKNRREEEQVDMDSLEEIKKDNLEAAKQQKQKT
jgi:hypothetical protein